MMLCARGIVSENTFSNFSLPKCGSAEIIHSLALPVSRKDYSKSDDEYSDPSIILDSDDDEDDDCILSDFDLPDDFTIPFQKALIRPKETNYDMAQVLQNEEKAQIIPYGKINEMQGSKFSQYRFLLADWLFHLSFCYPTNTETLFQCFHVLDTYLSKRHVPHAKLQLIGCCCLWICSKVDFHTIETLDPLTKNCHEKYTKAEFRQAEIDILTAVDYKIQNASANYFLKSFLEKIVPNQKLTAIATFYSEVSLMYMNFSSYAPSVIALSSLLIANKLLNNCCDLSPLKCYLNNVNKNDVILCMNMLYKSGGNIITREKLGVCRKLRRRYQQKDVDMLIAKSTDLYESFNPVH